MTATIAPFEDPETRRTRRLLATGKRVGIVGLVVLLIGGAMLGIGLYRLFNGLSQTRERLTAEVAVPGTSQVDLEPGTYDVVAIGDGLIQRVGSTGQEQRTERTEFPVPTIIITDSTGTSITRSASSSSFNYSNNDYDLVSMGSFHVSAADTYRIDVIGEPGQVTSIGVGPADDSGGSALALGGGALLALGGLVTIGGIITYVIGRTRRTRRERGLGSIPGWTPAMGAAPYGSAPYRSGYANGPPNPASSGSFLPPPPPPPTT